MNNDLQFFRRLIVTAGAIMSSASMSILLFDWLDSVVDKPVIAALAGMAGGLAWQIEKRLNVKKPD